MADHEVRGGCEGSSRTRRSVAPGTELDVARFLRLHFTEKIHAMELIEYGEAASITEALPTASGAWEEAQRRKRAG